LRGQPSRSNLVIASAIIIAVILVATSLFFTFGGAPKATTSTDTDTATETNSLNTASVTNETTITMTTSNVTSTYVSPMVLQLRVRLNATTMRSGGAIAAEITIFNPLDEDVSIAPNYESNSSILAWNGRDFICGGVPAGNPVWSLAGYGLFEGHYTPANLSLAGSPLTLIPPLFVSCPATPSPSTVVFLPKGTSTVAYSQPDQGAMIRQAVMNATTQVCVNMGYYNCSSGTSLFGYWTETPNPNFSDQNATTSSPFFHYFPQGEYTLVVEDMWGQASYSYFEVTA
jgi:hypothetical protein